MLIKHIAILIILTVLVLIGHGILSQGLGLWMDLELWLGHYLGDVFSNTGAGGWIKRMLAFLAVPLVVTFLPAAIYWCIKRRAMPHMKEIFWALWLIQAVVFCLNTSLLAG